MRWHRAERTFPAAMGHSRIHDPLRWQALRLAGPIAAAYLVIVVGMLVEYHVVGHGVGPAGIAALGLAGTLSLVLVLSFHALEIAVQAVSARRYGEGSLRETGRALDHGILISLVLGAPLALVLWLGAPWIFAAAESPEAERLAIEYFRWRLPGLPILISVLSIIGFFNAIGRPIIPAIVYAVIIGLNAVLCIGLVEGRWGLPAMGIAGAGLSQTVAAVVGGVIFLGILAQPSYRGRFGALRAWRPDGVLVRQLLVLAAPVFVQQFLANFGMYLFALINARVPDDGLSLAASTLARQVGYLSYLPSIGFGMAAATMVGQQLGAGEPSRARRAGILCWMIGAAFMGAMGLCFVLFGGLLAGLFVKEGEANGLDPARVVGLAATLLLVIGFCQLPESASTILGKALQGAGATRSVMLVSAGFQWLLFLPLAWLFALVLEMGALGAMLALAIQLTGAAIVMTWLFLRGRWQSRKV